MNPNRALTLYEGVEATSPFGAWMEILRRRLGDDEETLEGTFSAFPLVSVLVDGLLLVCRSVASRHEFALTSADQARLEVLPYVNRLVNTGLVLAHPSIEAAADAFEQRVILPVLHGNKDWAMLCAKYFAALVKTAREAGERLARFERDLMEFERTEARLAGAQLLESEQLHMLAGDAELLAFSDRAHRTGGAWMDASELFVAERIVKALATMADLQARRDAVLALPFDLRPLRKEVELIARGSTNAFVEQQWLETQLWLALLNAPPSVQHITYPELVSALPMRGGVSDDELVERFFVRMQARGASFSAEARTVLERRVRQRTIPRLRGRPATVSTKEANEIFLRVSIDDLVATHEIAFDALVGDARRITELMEHAAIDRVGGPLEEGELYEGLLDRVDWSILSFKQIRDLLTRGKVQPSQILERFDQMNMDVLRKLARWLLKTDRLTLNAATLFEHNMMLEVDMKFFLAHTEITPLSLRAELFRSVLYGFETHNADVARTTHVKLVDVMASVPALELRAIADEENERERFIAFVDNLATSADVKAHEKVEAMRDALGFEAFARLVLAEEVRMRFARYTVERTDDDWKVYEPPWGMWRAYNLLQNPVELFGSERTADEAYETYSETDVLDWYTQCPAVGTRYAALYTTARQRYERRFARRSKRTQKKTD